MRKRLIAFGLATALALCGFGWYARAQIGNLFANTLTGTECWEASQGAGGQGPGGTGIYICSNLLFAAQGTQVVTTATGTFNGNLLAADYVFTAALTGNVTFNAPSSPVPNGFIVEIINGTGSSFTSNIVFTAASGQTLVGTGTITNLANASSAEYRYALSTNTWYKVR